MDGVERGCFDHLHQEQGQIGAADGVVDEGTHGAAAASPIRCHGVYQIPTSVTRPNVGAAEIGLKKASIVVGCLFCCWRVGWASFSSFPDRAWGSTLYYTRKWG